MGETITSFDITPPVPRKRSASIPRLESRYETARHLPSQRGLWANADGMSANALNDFGTRYRLRNRSRYEDQNNGYYSGLIGDRANETIGTGPRLQMGLEQDEAARLIEQRWKAHCESIGLLDKLLVLDETETRDGETFGLLFNNPVLPEESPQTDLRLYEADQCHTPDLAFNETQAVDGIRFDAAGNPVEYHFLRQHPGDIGLASLSPLEYDRYPAGRVIHFFKPKRPGQARGVPGAQSSLSLYGMTRAYTAATLATAQRQATLGGTVESQEQLAYGDDEEGDGAVEIKPGEMVPIGGTEFWSLPAGVTAKPFDPTQPTTRYGEFKNEVVTEAGRPINAPRSVSTGSAAEYNYSSGRLDQQQWQRAIRIRRHRLVTLVLNRLFRAWLREALLIPGFLPAGLPPVAEWSWTWRWPGFVSIDPVKDATANQIALESGQTTLDRVCGEQGEDWAEVLEQRARERKKALSLGLPDPFVPASAAKPKPSTDPATDREDSTDG